MEEIRWRRDLANDPAVTLKESCRPSRAAQGHENTPLSHTHTHRDLTRLENMHNENPDCMFFKFDVVLQVQRDMLEKPGQVGVRFSRASGGTLQSR